MPLTQENYNYCKRFWLKKKHMHLSQRCIFQGNGFSMKALK